MTANVLTPIVEIDTIKCRMKTGCYKRAFKVA
jgi:hypothetical protein